MLIQSHEYIAKLVHEHISDKFEINLNLKSLQYGSISPDLSWKKRKTPHYYNESIDYFTRDLNRILDEKKFLNIRAFSNKLGNLLHFSADYLCYAHNNEEIKTSLWAHMNYERSLHKAFHQNEGYDLVQVIDKNPLTMIQSLRKKYLLTAPGISKDVGYITLASLALAESLTGIILCPIAVVA